MDQTVRPIERILRGKAGGNDSSKALGHAAALARVASDPQGKGAPASIKAVIGARVGRMVSIGKLF